MAVLPKGFRKIRYFGFLSPRYKKENIRIIRELIGKNGDAFIPPIKETTQEMMLRLTEKDINCCPVCGKGCMIQGIEIEPGYHTPILYRAEKKRCAIHRKLYIDNLRVIFLNGVCLYRRGASKKSDFFKK